MTAPGVWAAGVLMGYCFGCLDAAWIIGFMNGVDIKKAGNKNAGAGNALMTMGLKAGILTAAWDILKSVFAYGMLAYVFHGSRPVCILAAGMSVVGHVWPFWLYFDGGKGFAPYIGFLLCLDLKAALCFAAVGGALAAVTDKIVAFTFLCLIAGPAVAWIFGPGMFPCVLAAGLSLICFFRHRENIVNLICCREPSLRASFRQGRNRNDKGDNPDHDLGTR